MADNKDDIKETNDLLEYNLNLRKKELQILEQRAKILGQSVDLTGTDQEKLSELLRLQESLKQQLSEMDVLDSKRIDSINEMIDSLGRVASLDGIGSIELQKKLDLLSKQATLLKEEQKNTENNLDNYLGIGKEVFSIKDRVSEIHKISKLRLTDEQMMLKQQQAAAAMYTQIIDRVTKLASAILDASLNIDNSARSLMRTANFSYDEAVGSLLDASTMAAGAGISIEKLGASMSTLKENFSGYTELTAESKNKVLEMTAALDNMGLSSQVQAKFMDMSTKSLGMSMGQSQNFLMSMKGFADQAGVSMGKISKDLEANASSLANFGSQGVQVFKEMELASKQLGIEMSRLFSITEKFTTFEDAAMAAGKLNAVLGGDFINSVDLLSASMEDPVQAMTLFKDAMDSSGKSFDEMDNGMKRVVAQAMGMSVEEAGRLFAMDINTATSAMREQAATQETLNKLSGQMTDLTTKLQTAFAALYPALEPIISTMGSVIDVFTSAMVTIGQFIKDNELLITIMQGIAIVVSVVAGALAFLGAVLLPVVGTWASLKFAGVGLKSVFSLMKSDLQSLTGLFSATAGSTKVLDSQLDSLQKEFIETGASSTAAATGTASVGTSSAAAGTAAGTGAAGFKAAAIGILAIGVGVGVAAAGLSLLVSSFKDLGDAAGPAAVAVIGFTVAFGGLMIALLSMVSGPQAILTTAAVAVLTSIGTAALMIGGGMALAGAGIALVIASVSLLASSSAELITQMNSISDDTISRYEQLTLIFASLAEQISKIDETGVLDGLASAASVSLTSENKAASNSIDSFGKISSPSTSLEFNLGSTVSDQGSNLQKQDKSIIINIEIDSPITLEEKPLGRFVQKITKEVFASTIG